MQQQAVEILAKAIRQEIITAIDTCGDDFSNLNEKINSIVQGYTVNLWEKVNLPEISNYLVSKAQGAGKPLP